MFAQVYQKWSIFLNLIVAAMLVCLGIVICSVTISGVFKDTAPQHGRPPADLDGNRWEYRSKSRWIFTASSIVKILLGLFLVAGGVAIVLASSQSIL